MGDLFNANRERVHAIKAQRLHPQEVAVSTARERVEQEQFELFERLTKLRQFRDDPESPFRRLSVAAQNLLHVQANAMATYNAVLIARLDAWSEPTP
jgi:hypothetical protein